MADSHDAAEFFAIQMDEFAWIFSLIPDDRRSLLQAFQA
jgi:hypothetical protein